MYRRPFLCLTRSDTTAYCAALGQHYVQDESNFSDAYARNRIRHYAVPALQTINPAAEQAVGRLCNQLQELNIWLENLAGKLLAQAACGGGYSIPILPRRMPRCWLLPCACWQPARVTLKKNMCRLLRPLFGRAAVRYS